MKKFAKFIGSPALPFASAIFLGVLALLTLAGCQNSKHTSDPRLRQIDEMLDAQLPTGTNKSRVTVYLSAQGFTLESTTDPRTIVAIVRHVDTDTLQPATARVTFHFDAGEKLKSYELAPMPGSNSQP